jgi:hypothetical protein
MNDVQPRACPVGTFLERNTSASPDLAFEMKDGPMFVEDCDRADNWETWQ